MAAKAVALEVREDVAQRLVAQLADRARRQLEPVALALEVAGLLQLLGDLAQPLEIAGGLLAEQPLDLGGVDLLEVVGRLGAAELALELLHLLHLVHQLHGLAHRQLVVAAEVVAAAQLLGDAELVEVHRELGHLGLEPLVLHEQARHHLLELAALLGRHALHERLHARRLPRDLVEQLVEALDVREVLPPLLLERVEVGLVAFRALAQHAVDVAQHLAHPLHVVGAHAVERLLHPLHERLHHLLLQRLHQLLELPLGVLVGEVVVLELLDPAGGLGRELVEGVELPGALPRLLDLALDPGALGLEDLVQLLLDVVQRRAEIVAIELLLAPLPEPVQQVLDAGHPLALWVLGAALEHPAQRAPQVAVRHEVVGHRGQEVVGVEVGEVLRAVPA